MYDLHSFPQDQLSAPDKSLQLHQVSHLHDRLPPAYTPYIIWREWRRLDYACGSLTDLQTSLLHHQNLFFRVYIVHYCCGNCSGYFCFFIHNYSSFNLQKVLGLPLKLSLRHKFALYRNISVFLGRPDLTLAAHNLKSLYQTGPCGAWHYNGIYIPSSRSTERI